MRFAKAVFVRNVVMLLAFCAFVQAQSKDNEFTQDSCLHFSQDFYNWYLPNTHIKAMKQNGGPALQFALKNRPSAFEEELARQLEEGQAQAKREGEPFLDFDPVLNSQDPSPRYEVGRAILKNSHCWADVYGVSSGKRPEKPDVIAELAFKDGHWFFVDFCYPNAESPDNKSLVHMLRSLRKTDR